MIVDKDQNNNISIMEIAPDKYSLILKAIKHCIDSDVFYGEESIKMKHLLGDLNKDLKV